MARGSGEAQGVYQYYQTLVSPSYVRQWISGELRYWRYNSLSCGVLCRWKYGVHTPMSISVSHPTDREPLTLHPLPISKLRDECTGIPSLDAGPLPERPDRLDGFFYGDRTLEVRCIGLSLAHEFIQPLGLFGGHCRVHISKLSRDFNLEDVGLCTFAKVARVHHSRAQAEDEHTVFLVLCAELGHNDV